MKSDIATLLNSFLEHVNVQDRRQITGLVVKNCFVGSDAVDEMLKAKMASSREEAVHLARRLQKDLRMFQQARGGSQRFQDSNRHLYRLTIQESITNGAGIQDIVEKGPSGDHLSLKEKAQIFFCLAEVNEHKLGLKKYQSCFVGCEIVDRLVYSGVVKNRMEGVLLGRSLAKELSLFEHVRQTNYFTDDFSLYSFSSGVLAVIYDLHVTDKTNGKTFTSIKSAEKITGVAVKMNSTRSMVDYNQMKPLSESRLSSLGRLMPGRRKKGPSSHALVMAASDDESSALSAPDTVQSVFLDESKIGRSNSFDTLNDIIEKHGGLRNDSMSLYSLFEGSDRFPSKPKKQGKIQNSVIGEVNDKKSHQLRFGSSISKIPSPPPFGPDSLLPEDESIVSEPNDDKFDVSPRIVTDMKLRTYSEHNLRREIPESTNISIPAVQSALYLTSSEFSTILLDPYAADDDMTQITMDHCLGPVTVSSSEHDQWMVTSASSEEVSQLLERCSAPHRSQPEFPVQKITVRQDSPKQRPISSSKLSQQGEQSTSTGNSLDTSKQRITEILRKNLWSNKVAVVLTALEELCNLLDGDYPCGNGIHVVHCGGVMALMRTMEKHLHVESIQYYSCYALGQLALLDMSTQSAIFEMDALPLVVLSMKTHSSSSRLQEAGRSALASICQRVHA